MIAIAAGTLIFSTAMTPVQILSTRICLVATFYIPCLATFGAIAAGLILRRAAGVKVFTIVGVLVAARCVLGARVREFDKKRSRRGALLPMEK